MNVTLHQAPIWKLRTQSFVDPPCGPISPDLPSYIFTTPRTPPPIPPIPPLSLSLLPLTLSLTSPQLANLTGECIGETAQSQDRAAAAAAEQNRWVVLRLYEALNARDVDTVQLLVAEDIDWRFHGPPACQHMMRLLTGAEESSDSTFEFVPLSVEAFGPNTVLVEGSGRDRSVLWVHAWTVVEGVITQVREYFNTSVTVTRIGGKRAAAANYCSLPVWQSKLSERAGKSVPGLVLAI